MVALLKLSVLLFCLASVSAIEKALLDTFAEVVINAINKDETSGPYLYVLFGYSNVEETDDGGVSFDLAAAQTTCPKDTPLRKTPISDPRCLMGQLSFGQPSVDDIRIDPVILKVVLFKMVALLKLSVLLFCLASVSAIEKALLDTFAQVVVNAINKDKTSGPNLYVLLGYDNVEETDDGGVSFDLVAAQTPCPKNTPVIDAIILKAVLSKMVALLKLSVLLLCLASVSAIEKALLDTFAEVVINAINNDESSGPNLYVLYGYTNAEETDKGINFDLVAARTSCLKEIQEKEKCTPNDDSPVLFHKVSVAKKGDNVYSVTNTGPMVPLEVDPVTLKVVLSKMVALLKLAAILLCLASVSAIEKALLDKFAQAVVNGINNDKDSGDKLFVVLGYFNVMETEEAVTFDVIAVQTSCPKGSQVSFYELRLCHYATQRTNRLTYGRVAIALLDTFAEVVINAINKDETSGRNLYVLYGYTNAEETDKGITFDLVAAQTSCPKETEEKEKCKADDDAPVLFHKVNVIKKGDNVYSVTNTGSMVPFQVAPVTLKVVLCKMVALLKLTAILLCFASVSAIEKALLDKFAQAAVNGINKDKRSGDKLFVVLSYFKVMETDEAVTFDVIAVQTSCPKGTKDGPECKTNEKSPVLQHKVTATKKRNGVYSVASTGPMDPDSKGNVEHIATINLGRGFGILMEKCTKGTMICCRATTECTAEMVLLKEHFSADKSITAYDLIIKVVLSEMVALFKLSVILLCLASVSAIEEALLKRFARLAVRGINKDKDSGDKIFIVHSYSNVIETDDKISFDLVAIQTSCLKAVMDDQGECKGNGNSPVLLHKVVVTKKPGGAYSVASTGPMDPDSQETLNTLNLESA
ncbi:hypothetical protein M514_13659 [Trichuris suis]|uniref:Cystatin domain-containing protein n=2 Tax=Trichuris suis TaxID=68888 RepID=A0A085N530_9BILA|nr:hypothetical protein M514_13659 [Trichuris suis]